jgi:hypothetical protein
MEGDVKFTRRPLDTWERKPVPCVGLDVSEDRKSLASAGIRTQHRSELTLVRIPRLLSGFHRFLSVF